MFVYALKTDALLPTECETSLLTSDSCHADCELLTWNLFLHKIKKTNGKGNYNEIVTIT